jgi:hypothetical protein
MSLILSVSLSFNRPFSIDILFIFLLIVDLLFSVVPFMIALILIFLWLMIDQAFLTMKQTHK